MKKRPIQAAWEGYQKMVVPTDASETQVNETRQAFFAGAAVLFDAIMLGLSPGPNESEGEMQMMSNIQEEIREFGQQIDSRILGKTKH